MKFCDFIKLFYLTKKKNNLNFFRSDKLILNIYKVFKNKIFLDCRCGLQLEIV